MYYEKSNLSACIMYGTGNGCTPFLKGEEFEAEGEKIKKDDIEKLLIVETAVRQLGDYKLVERFIKETQTYGEKFVNEKYPGFFVKDITEEILK